MGAINWDISIFEERFARPGEEVPVRLVEEYSGGKGANVAVAAARIMGPGRVALIAALGDDEVSGMQVGGLKAEGVSADGVAILKGRRSGKAYIVIDGEGRKTIHTHFGANEELQPGHLLGRRASEVLAKSSMVVVMDCPIGVASQAETLSAQYGARLLYSPGVRSREGLRTLEKVIRAAHTLVVDSNELKNLCRTGDVPFALAKLRKRFPDVTVVATLGQRGCVVAKGGVTTRVEGVSLPKLGLRAVNSTGSGDAFLGVFASYVLMGRSPIEAVGWANLAGALKATRYETRGSPTRKELESRLRTLEKIKR
ncbi:MAG: carbohydrate kinase family protein [Thaumarchaeota archaeon]|nr:carbohydrate kinase family protein [Nitrososphaerota archaeon]